LPILIPHAFAPAAPINAGNIEANNDIVKLYLNGNIQVADMSATTRWCKQPFVMTGFYNAIINQHEFATGMVQGAPELPKFQIGAMGVAMGNAESALLNTPQPPTYPVSNGNSELPRSYIHFTLEASAYIVYSITMQMYPLDDDTLAYSEAFKSTVFTLDVNGVLQNGSKHVCQGMGDVGADYTNVPDANVIPPYEGIREFRYTYIDKLAAGQHKIGLQACSNEQVTWVGRLGISMEAYY
jgi:hypothetical protein